MQSNVWVINHHTQQFLRQGKEGSSHMALSGCNCVKRSYEAWSCLHWYLHWLTAYYNRIRKKEWEIKMEKVRHTETVTIIWFFVLISTLNTGVSKVQKKKYLRIVWVGLSFESGWRDSLPEPAWRGSPGGEELRFLVLSLSMMSVSARQLS